MRFVLKSLALALVIASTGFQAEACRIRGGFDPHAIQHADVVVIGRISDYEIVRDPEARRQRQRMLAANPDISAALRATMEGQSDFLSDYARFTVTVDRTLRGEAANTIIAAWDNSTFGEPETLEPGPYLIALGNPENFFAGAYPGAHWVLQQPCRPPFILDLASTDAAAVIHLLRTEASEEP